jgi:hypothetical protein
MTLSRGIKPWISEVKGADFNFRNLFTICITLGFVVWLVKIKTSECVPSEIFYPDFIGAESQVIEAATQFLILFSRGPCFIRISVDHRSCIIGRFRTSTKTITNTDVIASWVRASKS